MLLFAAFLLAVPAVTADAEAGAWLDAPPVPWNQPGMALPDAPANVPPPYCKKFDRRATTNDERKVAARGWLLFATLQGGGVRVVGASATEDGMCRPDEYQYFVFVRGEFAGTLSPRFMRARSDGSINRIAVSPEGGITAWFSRYMSDDPLCCPSRASEASYEVVRESGKPVVRLQRVQTRP